MTLDDLKLSEIVSLGFQFDTCLSGKVAIIRGAGFAATYWPATDRFTFRHTRPGNNSIRRDEGFDNLMRLLQSSTILNHLTRVS